MVPVRSVAGGAVHATSGSGRTDSLTPSRECGCGVLMMAKKINPRRRPATWADVERARKEAQDDALHLAMALFLTVLLDKFGGEEYIGQVWTEVNKLSQEVSEGRVNLLDLRQTLLDEYSIELA